MVTLTPRERVNMALNHREPDRVPIDIGGISSTIDASGYKALVNYLGMDDELQREDLKDTSNSVIPCEEILERFGVDTRVLSEVRVLSGTRALNTRSPQEVRRNFDDKTRVDEWGVEWARAEDGNYMNKKGPFQGKQISVADLERHIWPDTGNPARMQGIAERARRLHEETDYAIVVQLGNSMVALCQRLRGFVEWMEDLVMNPLVAEALLDHVTNVNVTFARAVLDQVGPYVDIVSFGDDLGFQERPYMRPELYREKVKPFHRRLVDAIKSKTDAKVVMHSDGSIYKLIPDLIDTGIDGINPVQVSATDMDSKRLKAEFGDSLCFWGGIDTQHVLPFGSTDDVVAEVQKRISHLAPSGGYVLATVHTMRPEVPPANMVAMYKTALKYGVYR